MQFITWFFVALGVVLLFGASVFVHEFGHYWMARRRGLRVDGFSIGFGPKIISWTRDGIEYAWRWIPAGGFVKLPQMVTSETIEGKSTTAEPLPPISPFSKILVALAGPVMNICFAFLIATVIYFVGLPVIINPAIVGEVNADSAEGKQGVKTGDRIVAVNGKMVKSWEDAQMIVAVARTNVIAVEIERDAKRLTFHLPAKVNEQLGLKLLDLDPLSHPVIDGVNPGSAAEAAGLKEGDEVLSFNDVPVVGPQQLINLIRARPGQPTPIVVMRAKERVSLTATPALDPSTKAGRLGMAIAPNLSSTYQVQRPGPLPWQLVGRVIQQTFDTITALIHTKETGVGVKDLSGPPGILAILAIELKTDIRLALKFMVLLNVSLGILNLLPLPVLDGGHIVLACLEKLRGRPLSARFQEYATTAFAALLITFMLYVSYNDVVRRFPLFRSMFDQESQVEPAPR